MPHSREVKLSPQEEMARIDDLLLQLRRYKTDDALRERASVNRTLSTLRLEFSDHTWWIPKDGTVVYFGSLLYADPRKYDIDLLLVSPKELSQESEQQVIDEVGGRLEHVRFADTRVSPFEQPAVTSIERIQTYAKMKHFFRRQTRDLADLAAHEAAMLLSGEPLVSWPYLQERLPRFQSDVRNILGRGSSHFRRSVINHLNTTLVTRQQRRRM